MSVERSPKAIEIINHTRSLLTSGGYKSFSYADLAERVQIRKASIHHHFPAKADLVQAVVSEYRQEAWAGMAATSQHFSNDPLAELNGYVNFWANCIRENSSPFCICVMLAVELPTLPEEVATEVKGHFSDLSEWLATVLSKGEKSGVFILQEKAAAEAKSVMATVHGAMIAARAFNHPDLFLQIVQPVINKLLPAS
ncbi:TetR/AcrR family transcriptional regulator [Pantoea sp. EA-12]|uniref:TetR/AcrR family transcriptional regulator n=1 Tax=Pantoea sp. EA-12 TaxID=3043303 RepID=UPI0024B5BBE5|nr:TetR/AcrR family transcriptional regulator [Pantoea sp. EA-12]MDI9222454.1 TetR/AcrR family transcriptional regulator [Pantoea sp. EA-12]